MTALLPPISIARNIAMQMGGVEPLIAGLLAQHGPAWNAREGLAPIVSEWCDHSNYTSVSDRAWRELWIMMLTEWSSATVEA